MASLTYFGVVRELLDRAIPLLCQSRQITRDSALQNIASFLPRMRNEWFSGEPPVIPYEDPFCRVAYLYEHVPANASICEHTFRSDLGLCHFIQARIQKSGVLRVCALGGGPGTELLALSKFFLRTPPHTARFDLDFVVLDRVSNWSDSWDGMRNIIRRHTSAFAINGTFVPIDVTRPDSFDNILNFFGFDLYIMNYLVSEILETQLLRDFADTLRRMTDPGPPGMKVLIIDRWQQVIVNASRELLATAGLRVYNERTLDGSMDTDEQVDKDLAPYVSQLGQRPRVRWSAFSLAGTKNG